MDASILIAVVELASALVALATAIIGLLTIVRGQNPTGTSKKKGRNQ